MSSAQRGDPYSRGRGCLYMFPGFLPSWVRLLLWLPGLAGPGRASHIRGRLRRGAEPGRSEGCPIVRSFNGEKGLTINVIFERETSMCVCMHVCV